MSNLNDPLELTGDGIRAIRVAEAAGAEHLGASVYELRPGDEMVFHYHVQREELLIVLSGRVALRTAPAGRSFRKAKSWLSRVAPLVRTAAATTGRRRFAC
jgi:5-deoxy-D-glucuronate isomerase